MTRVVIRADASHRIGHGHVMRCLTLGTELRARGAEVAFVCREHPGHLCDLVADRGFPVQRLPLAHAQDAQSDAAWLGASSGEDAAATLAAAPGMVDWVIADHYAIGAEWERSVAPGTRKVMVIDDLANRPHECDLLLDQNHVAALESRYDGLLPASSRRLLGPRFAMLQREYAALRNSMRARQTPPVRLLIAFGGADRFDLTSRCLSAAMSLKRADMEIDVVMSGDSPCREAVEMLAATGAAVRVHHALPSLAPLIASADLGIGAGGGTSWERLCLGLPSLVITLADNQRPIAEALARDGYVVSLGDAAGVGEGAIATALAALLDALPDREWSERCMRLVDARGASRVAAALMADHDTLLCARPATVADEALLLEWANDPVNRANSFSPAEITAASHRAWLAARLGSPSCRIFVVETSDGHPVGQVRLDAGAVGWVIDYSIAPEHRGCGLGNRLLRAALAAFASAEPHARLIGVVKGDNEASNGVFARLRFAREQAGETVRWTASTDALS